jgi:uncharacterized phage protein (TIGR02220 family)
MARMSIDDMFLRDPRVKRFALSLNCSHFEVEGRLLHVYGLVYDRVDAGGDDTLQAIDIDTAAELVGFADRMIEHGLAARERRGVRIKGAKERTNYLATREESGRRGGLKSGETRRNKSKVTFEAKQRSNEGRSNPSAPDSASADPSVDPTHTKKERARESGVGSDPDLTRSPPEASGSGEHPAIAILAKLSSHNGVEYSGTREHKQLIADRLSEGITVDELRMVIGYCALELGWRDRPEMLASLRPETLFGSSISKYLDPARSWFRKIQEQERDRRTP